MDKLLNAGNEYNICDNIKQKNIFKNVTLNYIRNVFIIIYVTKVLIHESHLTGTYI